MGFIKEFKDFAMKGNVVDLAIGVVIGAAFGKIVSSLVEDVITPLILTPALKLAELENIAELKAGNIKYGSFIAQILNFVIVALALFVVVKAINASRKKQETEPSVPAAPSKEEQLLSEIRDLLKEQNGR